MLPPPGGQTDLRFVTVVIINAIVPGYLGRRGVAASRPLLTKGARRERECAFQIARFQLGHDIRLPWRRVASCCRGHSTRQSWAAAGRRIEQRRPAKRDASARNKCRTAAALRSIRLITEREPRVISAPPIRSRLSLSKYKRVRLGVCDFAGLFGSPGGSKRRVSNFLVFFVVYSSNFRPGAHAPALHCLPRSEAGQHPAGRARSRAHLGSRIGVRFFEKEASRQRVSAALCSPFPPRARSDFVAARKTERRTEGIFDCSAGN